LNLFGRKPTYLPEDTLVRDSTCVALRCVAMLQCSGSLYPGMLGWLLQAQDRYGSLLLTPKPARGLSLIQIPNLIAITLLTPPPDSSRPASIPPLVLTAYHRRNRIFFPVS